MEELITKIRAAIYRAAEMESHVPAWQAEEEARQIADGAGELLKQVEQGALTIEGVLAYLEKHAANARQFLLDSRPLENRSFPNAPEGRFTAKAEAVALPLIADYIRGLEESLFPGEGQPEAGQGQAMPEKELTFEGLFALPSVPGLVIRAMQEAEPHTLLNEDGEGILFGKAGVAPVVALVDALFARKLVKPGITPIAAYGAICRRFGFSPSARPGKARKEGAGTYQDYKECFRQFFLSNRPE